MREAHHSHSAQTAAVVFSSYLQYVSRHDFHAMSAALPWAIASRR